MGCGNMDYILIGLMCNRGHNDKYRVPDDDAVAGGICPCTSLIECPGVVAWKRKVPAPDGGHRPMVPEMPGPDRSAS